MLVKLIDKLLFGMMMLLALQVPQLADHYHQFLSGLYESTLWQVNQYQQTADHYGYPSIQAMIDHHLQNEVASVRADAQQKTITLVRLAELQNGLATFEQGNLLLESFYIFNPVRVDYLSKTLANFKPGIPLTVEGFAFGVIAGLLLNYLLLYPFSLWKRFKAHQKPSQSKQV